MKDVLIINLKRFGDIYQSAHLVNSLIENDSNTRVSYLVFDEFAPATECLNNIYQVFTVPRKKIITFYKNPIYNTGFGINELEIGLRPLIAISWNKVINFSNDKVSTHLTSYITQSTQASFSGIRFTEKQTIDYSGPWANVYNDIITSYSPSPINIVDVVHLQTEVKYSIKGERIKSNPQHDETVLKNFDRIRKNNLDKDGNLGKIIGIQIKASKRSKEIPSHVLVQLLQTYLHTPGLVPVILLAPNNEERVIVDKINESLDKKVINIEADFIALPSVVKNLDGVVTPDTFIKHLCDLLDIPCLEISLGPAALFQQGTCNPKSRILSYRADKRVFSYDEDEENFIDGEALSSNDIFKCSQIILGDLEEGVILDSTSKWTLYAPAKDRLGTFLANKDGFIDLETEMSYLLARQVLSRIFLRELAPEIFAYIIHTFEEVPLQKWIKDEKSCITVITKDLLAALRSLIQTQENTQKAQVFVTSLGKLLDRCQEKNLSTMPIFIFRGQLESLTSQSAESNFKEVENLLYGLKDYMQDTMFCLKELESFIAEKKQVKSKIRHSEYKASI